MTTYVAKRILRGLLTAFVSVTLTFAVLRLMPGDPAAALVDPRLSDAMRQQVLERFGLTEPLMTQYSLFLQGVLQGDLGISFRTLGPVTDLLMTRLPWTLLLMGASLTMTVLIGVPLGVLAAMSKGRWADHMVMAGAIGGRGIFVPWLGVGLLYVFAYQQPWLPLGGAIDIDAAGLPAVVSVARHLVLPVAALTVTTLANYVLFVRTGMVNVLQEDYVRTARAKGLAERVVTYKHALRNAILPTLTMLGLQLGMVAGGAVLTETVFAYPGLGRLIYESVLQQDFPVLQGAFILLAFTMIGANILVDLTYSWLDPRIQYGGGEAG